MASGGVGARAILADQAYRLFTALVFLAIYSVRILSWSRTVRCGLATFSLLGRGRLPERLLSYGTIGGVVDWIESTGEARSRLATLLGSAPIGIFWPQYWVSRPFIHATPGQSEVTRQWRANLEKLAGHPSLTSGVAAITSGKIEGPPSRQKKKEAWGRKGANGEVH